MGTIFFFQKCPNPIYYPIQEFEFRMMLESKEKSKQELVDYIYKELTGKLDRDSHSRMRSLGIK